MISINSKTEKALLSYYFLNTEAEHHLNELSRLLECDPANLSKKLKELEELGLFQSKKRGNQRLYCLNKDFFLFNEYKSIVSKTIGIEAQIKKILSSIPCIRSSFLFGSYANGGFDQWSDIDLLVVGNHDSLLLSKKLTRLEKKLNRQINVVEMTPKEFIMRQRRDPFIKEVMKKKIINLST